MMGVKTVGQYIYRWSPCHQDDLDVIYTGFFGQTGLHNVVEINYSWIVIEHPEDEEEYDHNWVPVIFAVNTTGDIWLVMPNIPFHLRIYLGSVFDLTSEGLKADLESQAKEYQLPILNFLLEYLPTEHITRVIKVVYNFAGEMEDLYYDGKFDPAGIDGPHGDSALWVDYRRVQNEFQKIDQQRQVKLNLENPYNIKIEITKPEKHEK